MGRLGAYSIHLGSVVSAGAKGVPIGAVALLMALAATHATGASGPDAAPRSSVQQVGDHLLHGDRLFDDPGGWRSWAEQAGVSVQLFYNQSLGWNPHGGADSRVTTGHDGSYDLIGFADLEPWLGRSGPELLLQVKGQYARSINADVGALSDPIDDADFDEAIYIDQLWLQERFWRDRFLLRAGFLEAQTVFDRNAYANNEDKQFSSTFLDNNPVVPLPNALGSVAILYPTPWLELAGGVIDADNKPRNAGFHTAFDNFESLTVYLEFAFKLRGLGGAGSLPGTYRLGFFRDGARKPVFSETGPTRSKTQRGHFGAYLSLDQLVWNEGGELGQGLGFFGRMGYADQDVNRIEWFGSLGFQYQGLVPTRDGDVFAVGGYVAEGSDSFRREIDRAFEGEGGIEVYYRAALLPWLHVTPDLQYIIDPGGNDDASDAVVGVLRFRVTF